MRIFERTSSPMSAACLLAVMLFASSAQARVYSFHRTTAPASGAEDQAAATQPTTQPATAGAVELTWLTRYADAIDTSRRTGQPIIVDVGAEWCVWCRELDRQIATDVVQQKLRNWTRLRLDADRDVDAVRSLAVGPIPALRVLSPTGQVIAWHNGYMKADELAAWLDAHARSFNPENRAELEASGPPDSAAIDHIVGQLTDRDPVLREAAVQRLTPYPNLAAAKVAAVFAGGKLRERLAARELLAAWKAPVDGLDPWKPETITDSALAALKKWSGQKHEAPAAATSLSVEDAALARHDIAAMLEASDPEEVESARERLARFGPALLPEVYAALKTAATDQDRQRLTALRYRAVASESRALQWPDGFDRLASMDAQVRHQALDELGKNVTAADSPLLLELFSDPDPLMRETSLRLLQTAGGGEVPAGMVRLLHDPEPNVRAAVLKQLAETPDPQMVPEVVKYLATEKDTDLIVHGIRFLREARGTAALNCLRSLLGHESWRVRAEAAEGLGAFVERNSSDSSVSAEQQADIYAAMIKLLDDPDGFVVSRALAVLKNAQVPSAVDAMVKLVKRRPEMAADAVKVLGSQNNDQASQVALRQFLTNPSPSVRALAVTSLGTNIGNDQLAPLLQDDSAKVRIAAAKLVNEYIGMARPDRQQNQAAVLPTDWEAWLADFHSDKGRPSWATALLAPLRKMFTSEDSQERLAAAIPLAALGDEKAIQSLPGFVKTAPEERWELAQALPWLPWDQRLALFNQLRTTGEDARMLGILAEEMALARNEKVAGTLWDLLNDPSADISVAAQVERALIHAYTGMDYWNFQQQSTNDEQRKPIVETAKRMAAQGSANQRLVALALLLSASPPDAGAAASDLLASGAGGEGLSAAALQILLLSQSREDGVKTAIARLSGAPAQRKIAVAYLAAGEAPLQIIGGQLYLAYFNPNLQFRVFSQGQPVEIKPPPGVTVPMLEPMLKDPDPEVAGYAGYLMCILGDRRGLDPIIHAWQSNRDDDTWRRLAYRAIAVINDDNLTPTLAEIYGTFQAREYNVRDFYWTIRIMTGPQVLKLRKRIRDEVGMGMLQ